MKWWLPVQCLVGMCALINWRCFSAQVTFAHCQSKQSKCFLLLGWWMSGWSKHWTLISAQANYMIATNREWGICGQWWNAHIWYYNQQTVKSPIVMVCNFHRQFRGLTLFTGGHTRHSWISILYWESETQIQGINPGIQLRFKPKTFWILVRSGRQAT